MTIAKGLFINYVETILVIYNPPLCLHFHSLTLKGIDNCWTITYPLLLVNVIFQWPKAEMQLMQGCECLNFPEKLEALILILFQDKDS